MNNDIPINEVVQAFWLENNKEQAFVPICVYCENSHWHGYERELFHGERERSHRVSHCGMHEWVDSSKYAFEEDLGYYLVPKNNKEYWIVSGELGTGHVLIDKDSELGQKLEADYGE